ncbi:hypothetical protein K0504_06365 [Neiella marina]|uniref:Uncharacterized protein n=1 Tax=Neiella holothuriorum TaxID=2870530 RepID=A0ABS7EG22_9GAMM|nr:hypothetical protein [Neiella holothuriorum]MBW8190657.1 hypothetical protein [Neiella holothuriorum]
MHQEERKKLEGEFSEQLQQESYKAGDGAVQASMLADLAAGQAGSSEGDVVFIAAWLASIAIALTSRPDKPEQFDVISEAWLPETFKGKKIDSVADANLALFEHTKDKIHAIAVSFGYDLKCLHGCKGRHQLYQLVQKAGVVAPREYTYVPERFTIRFYASPLRPVFYDAPINEIVGERVKYRTGLGNTYVIDMVAEYPINEHGEPELVGASDEHPFIKVPKGGRNIMSTRFGRELSRILFDRYALFGANWVRPRQLVYDGKIYTFDGVSVDARIDSYVSERTLLTVTD